MSASHPSIVPQLVRKDLHLLKHPILYWWLGGVASIFATAWAGADFFLIGTIVFITCAAGSGMHAVIQTVVEERREQTLPFIMSLPISVREYTTAKLIANLSVFSLVWLTLSGGCLVIFLGPEGMPNGSLPFVIIVLVGIYLAYTLVLAASLVSESIGITITAMVLANVLTQIFLWWVVTFEGISAFVKGSVAVWNGTALTVLIGQFLAIAVLIALTYLLQARKTDFV